MRAVMCFWPSGLLQAHLSTRYEICEWPGAEFESFLKMASLTSSLVTLWNGRSSFSRVVRSGW